jgi:hypothetical protein
MAYSDKTASVEIKRVWNDDDKPCCWNGKYGKLTRKCPFFFVDMPMYENCIELPTEGLCLYTGETVWGEGTPAWGVPEPCPVWAGDLKWE